MDCSRSRHHPPEAEVDVTDQESDTAPPEGGFGYSEAIERILALEEEVAELRARLEPLIETIARRLASGGASFEGPPPVEVPEPSPAEPPHSADSAPDARPTDSAEWDPRRKAECPECGRVVSADSLARHRRRAHSAAHSAPGDGS
jgi:hypothetical protein